MNEWRTTPTKTLPPCGAGGVHDTKANGKRSLWAVALISLITAVASATAVAAAKIDLRVTPSEVGKPITVRVLVSSNGDPVPDLTADDFSVRVQDRDAPLTGDLVVAPPSEDLGQRLSLMFVMDFTKTIRDTNALEPLQDATSAFVKNLSPGDFAGIIKFNSTQGPQVLLPFTEIVDAATTASTFDPVIYAPYDGVGTPLFDAIQLAVDTFEDPGVGLPPGPKAIVVTADGEDAPPSEASRLAVVQEARDNNFPIFTIGLGDVNDNSEWLNNMEQLAELSGGTYNDATVSPETAIDQAYAAVSASLKNEYVLSFDTGVTDCRTYPFTIEIEGVGTQTGAFAHRGCVPSGGGSSSGGGGGAFGPLGLIAGLSLLALRRRLPRT